MADDAFPLLIASDFVDADENVFVINCKFILGVAVVCFAGNTIELVKELNDVECKVVLLEVNSSIDGLMVVESDLDVDTTGLVGVAVAKFIRALVFSSKALVDMLTFPSTVPSIVVTIIGCGVLNSVNVVDFFNNIVDKPLCPTAALAVWD